MLPSQHWAHNFAVEADDIEYLTNLLLEKETPLSTGQLAEALIEYRLQKARSALEERFRDTHVYNPSQGYKIGQKLVFPHMDYTTATVTGVRAGENTEYGDFSVIAVQFNGDDEPREFAAELTMPHKLSQDANGLQNALFRDEEFSAEDILNWAGEVITARLDEKLRSLGELTHVARTWFPRDLILEVNEGHLNLAEAVLDLNQGGPLTTEEILEQIGGLGTSPLSLQVFSLNYALNNDARFDEVGPTGQVLWYLSRLKPAEVQTAPAPLRYTPIDYDRRLLDSEALQLEAEIDDELSDLEATTAADEAAVTLTYPHRRAGTLPLSSQVRHIFPTAQRTPHIWITLVDGQDDEEYTGWVVPGDRYVYGLAAFYSKHKLPIGAHITVSKAQTPGRIRVDFTAYRPRTEWIRLIGPKGDQITFENERRSIGADYDELMILGADDLQALDTVVQTVQQQKKSLVTLLKMIVPALGRLTPQGTAHAKTIYSALNVLRRCPPGPILATLEANPDFQNVGGHYWKLNDE